MFKRIMLKIRKLKISGCQLCLAGAVVVNFIVLLYLLSTLNKPSDQRHSVQEVFMSDEIHDRYIRQYSKQKKVLVPKNHLDVTILIREFENFENYVINITTELQKLNIDIPILIVSDRIPYPPLKIIHNSQTRLVVLNGSPALSVNQTKLENFLKSQFVLIVPDGLSVISASLLSEAIEYLETSAIQSLAISDNWKSLTCNSLHIDLKRWTMKYFEDIDKFPICDMVTGKHALLLNSKDFLDLPYSLHRPLLTSYYIQATLRGWKTELYQSNMLYSVQILYSHPHNQWKHKKNEKNLLMKLYKTIGIKKVIVNGHTEWYGCTKTSTRCFGTVVDKMPDYLYEGRWAPPCCLKALRETAAHVFKILNDNDVRYWLEGGSLLGAVRNNDIIPWDYDVDIGIYKDDIIKSKELVSCMEEAFIDEEGYKWEKAQEGDFFRVQYSDTNHLHVDIFPFYSRNGTMTKNTWFENHRQDTEFPERFLKPLQKITFAGVQASAPNHVKEFLVFKFGPGVIENPKYPNENIVQM